MYELEQIAEVVNVYTLDRVPEPPPEVSPDEALLGLKKLGVILAKDNDADDQYDEPELEKLWDSNGLWIGLYPQESMFYKLERFVQEFLVDYNASKAALRSGYCDAVHYGQREIQQHGASMRKMLRRIIRLRANNIAHQCGITSKRVMEEMASIAFSNIGDFIGKGGAVKDLNELPAAVLRSVKEVTIDGIFSGRGEEREQIGEQIKVKLYDKLDALKTLGQHIKALDIKSDGGQSGQSQKPVVILFGSSRDVGMQIGHTSAKNVVSAVVDTGADE